MSLKQRLNAGEMLYGVWSGIDHPSLAQILGCAGFDFVCVDLQHCFGTFGSLNAMLDGLDKVHSPALVRVPWNTPDYIMRALDLGAEGVIVPMVNSAQEAQIAAKACRYAPAGNRSWGPIWALARGGAPQPAEGDATAMCIVMIETADGLANLDEILAVDGVQAIYIGPNDLSLSLGLDRASYVDSEPLHRTIRDIIARAGSAGKIVGIDCAGAEQAHYWRDQGVNFVISANDAGLLLAAAQRAAGELKA